MALALAVRVAFLASKPFWRDEAWVALLVDHPLRAVTEARAVPIGFLLLTRLAAAIPVLPPEVTYRLLPLAAGLAVLPLLAGLATALGASRRTALAVMWIAAGLQPFVYYSRELKPYGLDLLLAVVLPLLAIRGFDASTSSANSRRALAVCLAIVPWVSFGGVFPACAVLGWGWLVWWRRGDAALRRDWMLATLAFAASFGTAYVLVVGAQSASPAIRSYWTHRLLASGGAPLAERVAIAAWRYASIACTYLFTGLWPGFVALAALGAWTWPRPHRAFLAWLCVASAAACVAVAVSDHYLLAQGRHLLFAAPVLLLWVANGLEVLARRLGPRFGTAVVLGLPAALALWWCAQSIEHRVRPYGSNWADFFRYDVIQDVDGAITRAERLVPDGEPVLVTVKSAYAFQLYARGRLPQAAYCERYCADFKRIARNWLGGVERRGWVLMTDEEIGPLGAWFDKAGFDRRQRVSTRGVRLLEIDRRRGTKVRPVRPPA